MKKKDYKIKKKNATSNVGSKKYAIFCFASVVDQKRNICNPRRRRQRQKNPQEQRETEAEVRRTYKILLIN